MDASRHNLLLLAFLWFAGRAALAGPVDLPVPSHEHPGLDGTNVGGRPATLPTSSSAPHAPASPRDTQAVGA